MGHRANAGRIIWALSATRASSALIAPPTAVSHPTGAFFSLKKKRPVHSFTLKKDSSFPIPSHPLA